MYCSIRADSLYNAYLCEFVKSMNYCGLADLGESAYK